MTEQNWLLKLEAYLIKRLLLPFGPHSKENMAGLKLKC